jgi:hypothetical protein
LLWIRCCGFKDIVLPREFWLDWKIRCGFEEL